MIRDKLKEVSNIYKKIEIKRMRTKSKTNTNWRS